MEMASYVVGTPAYPLQPQQTYLDYGSKVPDFIIRSDVLTVLIVLMVLVLFIYVYLIYRINNLGGSVAGAIGPTGPMGPVNPIGSWSFVSEGSELDLIHSGNVVATFSDPDQSPFGTDIFNVGTGNNYSVGMSSTTTQPGIIIGMRDPNGNLLGSSPGLLHILSNNGFAPLR